MGERRWRHNKRGTVYAETDRAELQLAENRPLYEGDTLVIYRGEDGKLWAREAGEFEDGRFTEIEPAPPVPSPVEIEALRNTIRDVSVARDTWIPAHRMEALDAALSPFHAAKETKDG